jgi:geranylgeranyl pyrophosphate synthase
VETLSKDKDLAIKKLAVKMEERSRKTLERFGQVSVSGVNHSQLLSILADVKAYWKDNFRPALTSFSCEAVGGQPEAADDVSLMITLMGAGLGIHDDIIDKSLNKHFRTTILGLHGVDDALLVGELFIVKALTQVREMVRKADNPKKIENIIEVYEGFFLEVWEGEFMETLCRRNLDTELKHYERILWMSAADTEACTRLGAILGGGSKIEVEALAEVGRRLGFLHRLADDVKDSLNWEGNLPWRLENESVPLPILYAAKSSKENYLKIKSILEQFPITPSDIRNVLEICFETDAFNYVLSMAKQNAMQATRKLRLLKKSGAKNALALMVEDAMANVKSLCL